MQPSPPIQGHASAPKRVAVDGGKFAATRTNGRTSGICPLRPGTLARVGLCTVEVRDGKWQFRNSSYGMQLMPTRLQRGHGLRLEWTEDEYTCRTGDHPQLFLLLINERNEGWIDDRGEYWASPRLWMRLLRRRCPRRTGSASPASDDTTTWPQVAGHGFRWPWQSTMP